MSNGSPPITSAPVPPSIAGIPQPVIVTGGQSLPPSFPLGSAGTWLPPPIVGEGGNAPFSTPVVPAAPVPPSVAGYPQPQFATGSGTAPTAASLFPAFTTSPPMQPIVLNSPVGGPPPPPLALPLPTTPGVAPITLSTTPIPGLPWGAPVIWTLPAVTGTAEVGEVLTTTNGTWVNNPTSFTYQWTRNRGAIAGATASTYTLVAADEGSNIACTVTAINQFGQQVAYSNVVGPIEPTPPDGEEEEPAEPTQTRSVNETPKRKTAYRKKK